ncbi:MAG TPA: C39 family peptidase [Anaerolineales bacterium]|nr:C39 family peptidase [Anaerolineales bacterium]HNN13957.1 C39 family peptidase [Anaerolineales bacterium]HNO31972.1 C39 family peptidase [Anaerolineales bacterium]
MQRLKSIDKRWLILVVVALGLGIALLPPVRSRLSIQYELLRSRIVYFFNPPSEAVFEPSEQNPLTIETAVGTARAAMLLTLTPEVTVTSTPKAGPTARPKVTSTPVPDTVILPGVTYVDQHGRWNYCGPANLTMALKFWGWKGDRDDVAKVVKPGSPDTKLNFIERGLPDKNVMPYELADFVNIETEYRALFRLGGDMDLIKRLIAAGYPVIVEKGYYERDYTGKIDWLGHYLFTTGYDDARGGFIVQDAYLKPGKDLLSKYQDYEDGWRSFNYLFIVVYPADRETDVLNILGPWQDENWAARHALEIAEEDIQTIKGNNLFFAYFNKGTSQVALNQYADASLAYDNAFRQYSSWDTTKGNRPFRMMWYQTGPYFAYYYAARYQDVINLANTTLYDTISKPTLEESLLWRGRAYYMIGETKSAVDDYRAALQVHTNWFPAVQALQELGIQP